MARWSRRPRRGKVIGTVIAVLAAIACIRFALRHAQALPPVTWDRAAVLAFSAALGLHLLALVLLALGWRRWLRALGHPLPASIVIPTFLGAQLAKYLPGNVFQYAARIELIRRHGPTRADATRSILLEAATLVLSGLGLTLAVAYGPGEALVQRLLEHLSPHRAARFFALIVIAGLGGLMIARRSWGRGGTPVLPLRVMATALATSVPFYLAFFTLQSLGLWLIANHLFAAEHMAFSLLWGIMALAWTAGFVTPGAPAGLGVRDLVLLAGIDALAGPGVALGIAGLHRLASVGGDATAFMVATWTRRRSAITAAGNAAKNAAKNATKEEVH